jgi:hypothetical protein
MKSILKEVLFIKFDQNLPIEFTWYTQARGGPCSSVGIATDFGLDGPETHLGRGEIFRTRPDRPWDPPSLLYNVLYHVFPGGKEAGRVANHSPPPSAEVENE